MANAYNNKVVLSNGTTLIDLSTDTVTDASHIMSGKVGHLADGSVVTGTGASESQVVSIEDVPNTTGTTAVITGVAAPEGSISITTNGTHDVTAYEEAIVNVPSQTPTIQPLSVTSNGTYTAPSGVDGYSPVTVNVSGGGGGGGNEDDPIRFFDYDGTLVASYTSVPASLPSVPTHSRLTNGTWNYTLAKIEAQFNATGTCDIGANYDTASGKTEIDIVLDDPDYLSPYLAISPYGTVTIDWGDGSGTDSMTGSSYTSPQCLQHIYASTGSYTITIDGRFGFYAASISNGAVLSGGPVMNARKTYTQCVTSILVGANARIGNYSFSGCYSLKSVAISSSVTSTIGSYAFYSCRPLVGVTIPNGVTTISSSAFNGCWSLKAVSIPNGITRINSSTFGNCYSLKSVTIPNSVTTVDSNAFSNCHSLERIVIPSSVGTINSSAFETCRSLVSVTILSNDATIGNSAFSACYSLKSVTIPSNATTINQNVFSNCQSLENVTIPNGVTTISSSAFTSCYSLKSITVPSGVTSIGAAAFYSCYSILGYHFLPTTPPTLANTNAFSNIVAGTIIYVPQGSLEAYQTATNWSTYASYMVEEE